MTKSINIDIPEGYEVDTQNSDLARGVVRFRIKEKKVDCREWSNANGSVGVRDDYALVVWLGTHHHDRLVLSPDYDWEITSDGEDRYLVPTRK